MTTPAPEKASDDAQKSLPPKKKSQYQARLDNQKAQLERHGNFAEVVIRTTPEGTDMINFARLWEYVLVQADRQTRGYVAKNSREDFEQTRRDFEDAVDFMVNKLRGSIERHKLDMTGTNFISRVAQRYNIAERKKKNADEGKKPAKPAAVAAEEAAPKVSKPKTQRAEKAAADEILDQLDE